VVRLKVTDNSDNNRLGIYVNNFFEKNITCLFPNTRTTYNTELSFPLSNDLMVFSSFV
jgi:hypothetical protein